MKWFGGLGWALLVMLAGCGSVPFLATPTPKPVPTAVTPLSVYADAALSNVLRDIGTAFQQEHPGLPVEFVFLDTGEMRARVMASLKPELVIAGQPEVLSALEQQNRVLSAPQLIVRDPLAVIVAKKNPAGIDQIEDLNRTDLRFVTAAPKTALGQATGQLVELLRHDAGFGPEFAAAFEAQVVAQPETAAEVVQMVTAGQADAGIVHRSDLGLYKDTVTVIPLPPGLNVSTDYAYVVLQSLHEPTRAESFAVYLRSPQALTLWRDYGFVVNQ